MCIAVRTYAFFRDGMANNWASSKRVDQRLQHLELTVVAKAAIPEKGVDGTESQPSADSCRVWVPKGSIVAHVCPHCGLVHRKENGQLVKDADCPYQALPKDERLKAIRLLQEDLSSIVANWAELTKKKKS